MLWYERLPPHSFTITVLETVWLLEQRGGLIGLASKQSLIKWTCSGFWLWGCKSWQSTAAWTWLWISLDLHRKTKDTSKRAQIQIFHDFSRLWNHSHSKCCIIWTGHITCDCTLTVFVWSEVTALSPPWTHSELLTEDSELLLNDKSVKKESMCLQLYKHLQLKFGQQWLNQSFSSLSITGLWLLNKWVWSSTGRSHADLLTALSSGMSSISPAVGCEPGQWRPAPPAEEVNWISAYLISVWDCFAGD